jgi:hypothetical protein
VSLVRGDANATDPGTDEEIGLKHEYRPGAVAQSNVCCVSHRELKLVLVRFSFLLSVRWAAEP